MAEQDGLHQSPHTSSSRTLTRVASATSLLPPTSAQGLTAADLLSHQALLESQAREAIPFAHSECTYTKGYIRQPLWACTTCGGGGVCAGCSIADHSDHTLVELFAKRATRCDCGTLSLQRNVPQSSGQSASSSSLQPCSLRPPPLNFAPENDLNVYNKNYDGAFCYCEKGYTYDPMEEEETMFQCLVCEDWLHETCLSLRPKRWKRKTAPLSGIAMTLKSENPGLQTTEVPMASSVVAEKVPASNGQEPATTKEENGDEEEEAPPLIAHDSFDNVICDACLRSHPILQHYIGAPSWGACLQVPPDAVSTLGAEPAEGKLLEFDTDTESGQASYLILGLPPNIEYTRSVNETRATQTGTKRELSPISEGAGDDGVDQDGRAKRPKIEGPAETSAGVTAFSSNSDASCSASALVADPKTTTEMQSLSANTTSAGPSTCKLPPVHPLVARLLALPNPLEGTTIHPNNPDNAQRPSYRVDVYLNEGDVEEDDAADPLAAVFDEDGASRGFRREICRCSTCHEAFKDLPFIVEEEQTYSPPASPSGLPFAADAANEEQDDDARSASSRSSTYDLGLDALNRLPRAQTLEAMEGYGRLRSALFEHLRPFAESGKMVDEESIRRFFDEQRERDRQRR